MRDILAGRSFFLTGSKLRTQRAIGAAGAQVPYKDKVGGSNPSSPTINFKNPLELSSRGFSVAGEDWLATAEGALLGPVRDCVVEHQFSVFNFEYAVGPFRHPFVVGDEEECCAD